MAAIKKEDVLNNLTQAMIATYAIHEQRINRLLDDAYDGNEVWYAVDGANTRVIAALLKNYTEAGWKVRFHIASDQRDNDSLIFE